MPVPKSVIERLIDEAQQEQGLVQNSPIRTGVWYQFLQHPDTAVELLLIPLRGTTAGKLCVSVNALISDQDELDWCTYNQSVVSGCLDFTTLISRILPLSAWWQREIEPSIDRVLRLASRKKTDKEVQAVWSDLNTQHARGRTSGLPAAMLWCIRMLGAVYRPQGEGAGHDEWPAAQEQLRRAGKLFKAARRAHAGRIEPQLFAVSRNRRAVPCLIDSVRTIKGDAARELFDIDCSRLTWAVIDSGIDRNHPTFTNSNGDSRVRHTVDFTLLGVMLRLASSPDEDDRKRLRDEFGLQAGDVRKLHRAVTSGDDVDWDIVAEALRVKEDDRVYYDGLDPHGTQVAGIVGGGHVDAADAGVGVCPDINFADFRVITDQRGDENTEFHIISALQYVRYLNRDKDKPVIHGVNLSLSLPHSVTDYGCGQTPICEECDRLVSSGVVVVAAAGNYGFDQTDITGPAATGGYRDLSVTDPGNAESVITVGATHGKYPHQYGVSFFSSRGPTGDGRAKPDLVAPGEGIVCPSRNQTYDSCSGTSMAAPHVSGAAALLMARHRGLIGNPDRVKDILCASSTDLGRAVEFQGRGLVDVLRAIQSI